MVLHEGIDLELFKPASVRLLDAPQQVITYVCRGLESVRCFLEFISTVKLVLLERPNVIVRIVGEDKAFYETTDKS
jgi:glycosyltransferase involved in cell wall biosynthesis